MTTGGIVQKQKSASCNQNFAFRRSTGRMSRGHGRLIGAFFLMAALPLSVANAQEPNRIKSEEPAISTITPKVINIWPGVAPGSEQWKHKETAIHMGPMESIVNVTTPTLTAYLPAPSKATGTAVIIAPGGGFLFLGTDTHEVAEWLAERGIAGFVLKYRTAPLEGTTDAELSQAGGARFGAQIRNYALIAEDGKHALDDGIQAIKVVRSHATEWGISPDRVGFMGFSAGGMIAEHTTIQPDVSARPNFAASIYGGYFPTVPPIPKDVPPFFMELAQDDTLAGPQIMLFYDALKAAGYKPELHLYEHGGHGWSMRKQGTTSDHWLDEFYWWLEAHRLARSIK
jgi:acetyl esterase/lipase